MNGHFWKFVAEYDTKNIGTLKITLKNNINGLYWKLHWNDAFVTKEC